MKILHITRDYPPRYGGGISTAVAGLVGALAQQSVAIDIVSFDGYRPKTRAPSPGPAIQEQAGDASILRIVHPAQLSDALIWATERDADICHCHHDLLWDFARRVGLERTVLSAHVLQRAQNRMRKIEGETLSSKAQDRAIAEAKCVLAPSSSARAQLLSDYPPFAGKISAVPLGVVDQAPARHPRAGVTFAGRFADIKGIGDLSEGMKSGALAGIAVEIVGGAPDSPRAQRRWQSQLVDAAEHGGVALELSGWTTPQRTFDRLARAQVVVCPSWIETFGLGCAEAMQAGAAVVASDIPAYRELVVDGEDAVLVPARSPNALATTLADLVADPQRCQRLGHAGREAIQSQWTWRNRIGAWLEAYASC